MRKRSAVQAQGRCVCGAIRFEIDVPAVWAWHDHGEASRHAQGCAYATYVGSWRSRFRIVEGAAEVTRFEDAETRSARSFCARCGTPLLFRYTDAARIGFAIGSLDDPSAVVPQKAFGTESKLSWADAVPGLPASTTEGDIPAERMEQLRSLQHPDHDTERRG